jgi:Tfp pilus assembly protein PilX
MNFRINALGRGLSICSCVMFLSGCALPLPFQIASWALDGISYLATEKSVTDHGISIVAQKDCALLRVVKGDEICSSNDDSGTIAVAATDTAVTDDEVAVLDVGSEYLAAAVTETETDYGTPKIANSILERVRSESKDGQRLLILGARIWSDRMNADTYFVVGSFFNRVNAHRLISKHSDLGPAVMVSLVDGDKVYRVAVGPFDSKQKKDMKLRLKESGISNAWAMRIDHQKWKLTSPQNFFNTGKSIAQAPAVSKPTTKAKPTQT